jgi:hypothetical protein
LDADYPEYGVLIPCRNTLAVPGGPDIENFDDLVAVWRSSEGLRFQNYRARFTILDVSEVSRVWIDDLIRRRDPLAHAPGVWADWVLKGRCRPLKAVRSIVSIGVQI